MKELKDVTTLSQLREYAENIIALDKAEIEKRVKEETEYERNRAIESFLATNTWHLIVKWLEELGFKYRKSIGDFYSNNYWITFERSSNKDFINFKTIYFNDSSSIYQSSLHIPDTKEKFEQFIEFFKNKNYPIL